MSQFLDACALPPEERPAFREASCGGDASLRSEVEAMPAAPDPAQAGQEPPGG